MKMIENTSTTFEPSEAEENNFHVIKDNHENISLNITAQICEDIEKSPSSCDEILSDYVDNLQFNTRLISPRKEVNYSVS